MSIPTTASIRTLLGLRWSVLASAGIHGAAIAAAWLVVAPPASGRGERAPLVFAAAPGAEESERWETIEFAAAAQAPPVVEPLPTEVSPTELPPVATDAPVEDLPALAVEADAEPADEDAADRTSPSLGVAGLRTRPRLSPSPAAPLAAAPSRPAVPVARRAPAPSSSSASRAALRPVNVPRVSAESYPPAAWRAGIEGSALVEFTVLPNGSAASPRLLQTSGSDVLDRDAVTRVLEYRFHPIEAERTVAVRMNYRLF